MLDLLLRLHPMVAKALVGAFGDYITNVKKLLISKDPSNALALSNGYHAIQLGVGHSNSDDNRVVSRFALATCLQPHH